MQFQRIDRMLACLRDNNSCTDLHYFRLLVLECDHGQYLAMGNFEARKKGVLSSIVAPSKDIEIHGVLINHVEYFCPPINHQILCSKRITNKQQHRLKKNIDNLQSLYLQAGDKLSYSTKDVTAILFDAETENIWIQTPKVTILLREPGPGYKTIYASMVKYQKEKNDLGGSVTSVASRIT